MIRNHYLDLREHHERGDIFAFVMVKAKNNGYKETRVHLYVSPDEPGQNRFGLVLHPRINVSNALQDQIIAHLEKRGYPNVKRENIIQADPAFIIADLVKLDSAEPKSDKKPRTHKKATFRP